MNKPTLRRNFIGNFSVSLFTILIPTLFLFFTIKEGLINSFASEVLKEMAAIDMVQKKHEGEYYNEETHTLDYINGLHEAVLDQEAIKKRFNEISYMFSLLPIAIILILIFVKGWSNIKSKVKHVDESIIASQIPLITGVGKIKWYVSKHTFSYGFLVNRIVLGTDYFFSPYEKKKFILNHELRHLKFRDSILKNFLINLKMFFLPIFFIFLWFFTFFIGMFQIFSPWIEEPSEVFPDLDTSQIVVLISYIVMPIVMIFLLQFSFRKITKWFSFIKEFLADQYAMIESNGYIPELKQNADKYHPSGENRMFFLKKNNRIVSAFPFLFFTIILLNINFGNSVISDEYYFIALFSILFVFVLLDIFYLKLHKINIKEWIGLFLLILFFGAWNFFILKFYQENYTFNYSPGSYLINLLTNMGLLLVLVIFGIAQLIINKINSRKKKTVINGE